MENKQHSFSKMLPVVKIYISDILEIIKVLEESGFSDVKLETRDEKLDKSEVDKLIGTKGERIGEIKITAKKNTSSLWYESLDIDFVASAFLSFNFNHFYSGNSDALVLGIFEKVRQILKSRRRLWLFNFFTNPIFGMLIPSLVMFLLFAVYLLSSKFIFNIGVHSTTLPLVLCFVSGLIFWFPIKKVFTGNIIILKNKKECKSFWQRKKDDLLLIGISSFFTAIITFLATYFALKAK